MNQPVLDKRLNAYYFRHNKMTLAPVYAHSEDEARCILITQHEWCKAPYNTPLINTEKGTEWERIVAHPFE